MQASQWYVATNGNNTTGNSWPTAFRDLQATINSAGVNDTIFLAGHTFKFTNQVEWKKSGMTIEGGYAATNAVGPGTNDPSRWPTVLTKSAGNIRILYIHHLTNSVLRKVTVTGGYIIPPSGNGGDRGGGILVCAAVNLKIDNCVVTNNRIQGGFFTYCYGAGMYLSNSTVSVTNTMILANNARQTYFDSVGGGHGAGIYVYNGASDIRRCVIRGNVSYTAGYGYAYGGGIYLSGGSHQIRNCVIVSNDASYKPLGGGGIYAAANANIVNCTVVNNIGEGIRRVSGTVTVTNCIIWNNGDDVFGSMGLYYCCIKDGTDEGRNGCITNDPQFVSSAWYHLRSAYGYYKGGYFSGGSWTNDTVTSPLVDACAPLILPRAEPHPNGCFVNMGAYGNTEVASKSHPLDVTNHAASAVGPTYAQLNAELLHLGSSNVHVRFYWGDGFNGGTNPAAWQTNVYVGKLTGPTPFHANLTGLLNGHTYYYTAFASNAGLAKAWGGTSRSFTAQNSGPEVQNTGVDNDGQAVVTLKGAVTSTGGDPPYVYVCWGPERAANDTGAWANVILKNIQTGTFSAGVVTEPGSNYWYNTYARNDFGSCWGTPMPFGAYKLIFVATSAAGAQDGQRWEDAFGRLSDAMSDCTTLKTNWICVQGGTFTLPDQIQWTNSNVVIQGGYEGTGYPGRKSTEYWPTMIRNTKNQIRLVAIQKVRNATLRDVILTGGNLPAHGGAVWISGATNVTLDNCKVFWNVAGGNPGHGGGLYTSNSSVTVRNSIFWGNRTLSNGKGGAIYAWGGTLLVRNSLVTQNDAPSQGDGLYAETGAGMTIENCTVAGNKGDGVRGPATVTVRNSILWKNTDDVAGTPVLQYNDISDGDSLGVNGCFSSDPLFSHGFYLSIGSPCTNRGDRTAAAAGVSDRTVFTNGTLDSGTVDLGYHAPSGLIGWRLADLYVSPGGNDLAAGTNWATAFRTVTRALAVSEVGTRTRVAAGTYATNTTETFPLVIEKPGISLQGAGALSTILLAGGNKRVVTVTNASFVQVGDLTLTGGYFASPSGGYGYGGGIFLFDVTQARISSCIITNNRVEGGWLTYNYGGGVYGNNSSAILTNCIVNNNRVRQTYFDSVGIGYGGGLYVNNGAWTIRDCVFAHNLAYCNGYGTARGGGMYLNGGIHEVRNCVVVSNDATWKPGGGCGIYANATIRFWNCTVVTNTGGDGFKRESGFVSITNSIFWANGDDLVNVASNVGFSCIEDGDFSGVNGNVSIDPLFVDRKYCHLASQSGDYRNGYSWGGTWQKSVINSPLIDKGNPKDSVGKEPLQNGRRINIGAYGGTVVASKTYSSATILMIK